MAWPKESRRHGLASKGIPTVSQPKIMQRECNLNGLARKKGITEKDVDPEELRIGIEIEMEHTGDREIAKQIALDHLAEFPNYYSELVKLEKRLGASGIKRFERGVRVGQYPLTAVNGEAGYGVYAFVPNPDMRDYYTSQGEELYGFQIDEEKIIDLTKETNDLIRFIKKDIDKTAEFMGEGYVKPKVDRSNYQRFGSSIMEYMVAKYPDASGYTVQHKGFGIPTGKQLIITKPEDVIVEE